MNPDYGIKMKPCESTGPISNDNTMGARAVRIREKQEQLQRMIMELGTYLLGPTPDRNAEGPVELGSCCIDETLVLIEGELNNSLDIMNNLLERIR